MIAAPPGAAAGLPALPHCWHAVPGALPAARPVPPIGSPGPLMKMLLLLAAVGSSQDVQGESAARRRC